MNSGPPVFVDASALVSILTREEDAENLERELLSTKGRFTSAVAVYEAVLAVARRKVASLTTVEADVAEFLNDSNIRIVTIGPAEAGIALEAHARFGKGRHAAGLNMGDCFAYACARTHGAALLYKGDDFALTDAARPDPGPP